MRIRFGVLVLAAGVAAATFLGHDAAAQKAARKTLEIYVVDVEGGNATLFVPPSGDTVLIDTGNTPPGAARDAERIMAAAKDAGVTQINHLIITHWHSDHFGGLPELAKRITIKQFIDHGASVESPQASGGFLENVYPAIYAKGVHTIAKAGDRIPVAGLDWRIVAAAGKVLQSPLPGAGKANPYCAGTKPMDADPTENAQSVSSYITFGKFRVVHMGDLTWNKELDLMCPNNRLGTADLFIVSHHGQPISNSPALVHALHPRVDIMNNGTRKGGQPETMRVLFSSPGLEDLWQLHFSQLSGQEYTVPGMFIANGVDAPQNSMPVAPMAAPAPGPGGTPAPQHEGPAFWIKVSALPDGTFTVENSRNGFAKTYEAKK